MACARWLGRPADVLEMAATDWSHLPVETSGNPHAIAQDEQDRLSRLTITRETVEEILGEAAQLLDEPNGQAEAAETMFDGGARSAVAAAVGCGRRGVGKADGRPPDGGL